jgi:phosphotransferase system IIA component
MQQGSIAAGEVLAPVNVCSGFSAVACQILTVPSSLHEASILPEGSHLSPLMSDLCAPCTAQQSEAVSRHAAGLSIHSKDQAARLLGLARSAQLCLQ